jgi:hypothetical protein
LISSINVKPPWIAVSQPELAQLMTVAEWLQTPPVMRLWIAAQSQMFNNGHAVFDRDELLVMLGSGGVDTETGELRPIVPLNNHGLARNARRLVTGGYLTDWKSSRSSGKVCFVVSANVAQMGKQGRNLECDVHHTYARLYAA